MYKPTLHRCCASFALLFVPILSVSCAKPVGNSATFDQDGTAHVTRVIPMPATISPEAQKWLDSLAQQEHRPQTLAERRASTDKWRAQDSAEARKLFPVNVEEKSMAGARTDVITPLEIPEANRACSLIFTVADLTPIQAR